MINGKAYGVDRRGQQSVQYAPGNFRTYGIFTHKCYNYIDFVRAIETETMILRASVRQHRRNQMSPPRAPQTVSTVPLITFRLDSQQRRLEVNGCCPGAQKARKMLRLLDIRRPPERGKKPLPIHDGADDMAG
jgi:hypothetical protein